MRKNILVTGGAGYIGSHTVTLLQQQYSVSILDNLSASSIDVLDNIATITGVRPAFYKVDLLDMLALNSVFEENQFDAVIHFAGCKQVDESITDPLKYYANNITGTLNLVSVMNKHDVNTLIFSSSAAVYGDASIPIVEYSNKCPTSVYGKTKSIVEDMLFDLYKSNNNWRIACLRYFNPTGAHSGGLLGDSGTSNLMSVICRAAIGELPYVQIFGGDYETPDGSAIRDYIHVMDLASGHLAILNWFENPGYIDVNIGTGTGVSVLQLIHTFSNATGQDVPYILANKRQGDIVISYANTDLITHLTDWRATHTLEQMCVDAWKWYSKSS